MTERARLIGDGIENPPNARVLLDAAAMHGLPCLFHDTRGLAESWSTDRGGQLPLVGTDTLLRELTPIVAVENVPGAESIYDASLPKGSPSIVVGNERRGIRGDVLRAAELCVEIPMPGRGVNTLNVAAAAAVALHYLLAKDRHPFRQSPNPERRRPALLLAGPGDHVEAGSTLRSAAAFGWRTVGLDDAHHVWFGVPRSTFAEGRAAARRHRNDTRILRMESRSALGFARAVVAGVRVDGPTLHRVDLAAGPSTLLVLPDEEALQVEWEGIAPKVDFARVELRSASFPYRYRLIASIVLAEAARQIGRMPAAARPRPAGRRFAYESALERLALQAADLVAPEELLEF